MENQNSGLYVIFTGAPGSGKGTQARILFEKTGIPQLSAGEMLRAEAASGSEIGLKISDILSRGDIVPDEITIAMMEKRISQPDCEKGFMLDGFPRTMKQATSLDEILHRKGIKLTAVLEIEVPESIILERILGRYTCMKCGQGYHEKFQKPKVYGVCDKCGGTEFSRRSDDNRETVENRIHVFKEITYPTIPYYEKQGILRKIDGTGTIDAVSKRIEKVLEIERK